MPIAGSVIDTVGYTPLVRLAAISRAAGVEVLAKLEHVNPAGSIKDRVARALIEDAEARGVLEPGATIVEPTSGNTGIALAMIAARRGYRLVLTMPEAMPKTRISLLQAYGAQVVLTPGALMRPAVEQAELYCESTPGAIMLRQFENPANPAAHERTTGQEIWRDTDGRVDVFVAGIGTGGTVTGVGRLLKRLSPATRVVGVEPAAAAVLTGGPVGNHILAGIGAGFVPKILDRGVLDEVLAIGEDEALDAARRVAREDGVPAGLSSGAALAATLRLSAREELRGRRFVVIFPDSGERYLGTRLADLPAVEPALAPPRVAGG
jgi:cysteine synthase